MDVRVLVDANTAGHPNVQHKQLRVTCKVVDHKPAPITTKIDEDNKVVSDMIHLGGCRMANSAHRRKAEENVGLVTFTTHRLAENASNNDAPLLGERPLLASCCVCPRTNILQP